MTVLFLALLANIFGMYFCFPRVKKAFELYNTNPKHVRLPYLKFHALAFVFFAYLSASLAGYIAHTLAHAPLH